MGLVVSPSAYVLPTSPTFGNINYGALTGNVNFQGYSSNITLDTSIADYHSVDALTGNPTVLLSNLTVGRTGLIWVKQDATGGRTITWAFPGGWSALKRDDNIADANPYAGANEITRFTYVLTRTFAGVYYVEIGKSKIV